MRSKNRVFSAVNSGSLPGIRSRLRVFLFLSALCLLPQVGFGEMQRYLDENGAEIFVDDSYLSTPERENLQKRVQATRQAERLSQTSRVEVLGNQVLVPVELNDGTKRIRARLLLDTGASQTVFHRRAVAPLRTRLLAKGFSRLADGQAVPTDQIRLKSLQVGPHTWENPTVYVIDAQGQEDIPFDGLLGMDFLRTHHYRIDFRQQLLHWQPVD